jgi:hypothetical protein
MNNALAPRTAGQALAPINRYLVTASGRHVGSRVLPALTLLGPLLGGPVLGAAVAILGGVLDLTVLSVLGVLGGLALFTGGVIAAWVFLLGGTNDITRGAQMWLAGDAVGPIPLCQKPLGRVFRADVRMRALYTLGLCAEANGDFAEAADLFQRAFAVVPAMAASKWKRRGQCMMLAHRTLALVAQGRLEEADAQVRLASSLFPPLPSGGGVLDALTDDAAFGAMGVSAALRDLEPGRDPRALLSLASVVLMSARGMGRESLELIDRERYFLTAGLLPREQALLAHVEARSRGLLGAGPMRSPGVAAGPEGAGAAWAERVLPLAHR